MSPLFPGPKARFPYTAPVRHRYNRLTQCILHRLHIFADILLGTGFQGAPREPIATVIAEINYVREKAGAYVIAVDINSGMNGDTGEAENAVVSDLTVSIGYYKTGFFTGKAPDIIGSLVNIDIGIELPESMVSEE